ncbi:MAG TPA: ABC transporter permease [Gemmatimonadaceae bacterium]|jgi:putative ABC transport system permease protein
MLPAARALLMDVGFAVRALRKNIAFSAASLATLAVGIGVAAAVFTVVNGVLLRPLPYRDPSRLQMIFLSSTRAALGNEMPLSLGFFDDLAKNQRTFSSVAAIQPWSPPLSDGGKPTPVQAALVTPNLFATLGIHPSLGRDLTTADGEMGASHVTMISDALWKQRFGASANVIGKRIALGNDSYTIVGVMPSGFAFPRGAELPAYAQFGPHTDLWAPLVITPKDREEYRALSSFAIGRLAGDATPPRVRADLTSVVEISLKKRPSTSTRLAYDVIDMQTQAGRHIRGPLLLLMSAALFVFLIACANVANLIFARTAARRRELAVRSALGAGRERIAAQLITENVLLALIGGALGVGISIVATRAMLALVPGTLPRADDIGVDWRVVAVAALVAAVVGITLGATSALQMGWRTMAQTLRDAGTRSTASRVARLGRNGLVVAEVSLAMMLVVGATLLITTFIQLQRVKPGLDVDRALTVGVIQPVTPPSADNSRTAQFYSQLIARLAGSPGVRSAAAVGGLPLTSTISRSGVRLADRPIPDPGKGPLAEFAMIEGPYFKTMGIAVVDGREFDATDIASSVPVIIVNRAFEHAYLDDHALGEQLLAPFDKSNGTTPRTIVGVVSDVSTSTLDDAIRPQVYLPEQQVPFNGLSLVVRTTGDALGALTTIEREVAALDPRAAVGDARTLRTIVDQSMARQRFAMTVMTVFAGSALFLTAVGLYGVIALSVGERRREMGVRMALGARAADVVGLVLGQTARITGLGLAIGVTGAFAVHRLIAAMLFGVSATNAMAYLVTAAMIAVVALVAAYVPARRAARVDPATVLRGD